MSRSYAPAGAAAGPGRDASQSKRLAHAERPLDAAPSTFEAPVEGWAPAELDLARLQRTLGNQAVGRLLGQSQSHRAPGESSRRPAGGTTASGSPALVASPELQHRHDATPGRERSRAGERDEVTSKVQRHASWEHKMLGDVDPETLEIISSGRDVKAEEEKRKSFWSKTRASAKTIKSDRGEAIDLDTVLHTIDQEIRRLRYFKDSPPTGTVGEATEDLQKRDQIAGNKTELDPKWDVRLVELSLKDGNKFLVTYGELNTLADFYGSAADISQTPADNFRGIVGGVREESIRKFMRLRNELTIEGDKPYDPDSAEHRVAGAIGNKGTTEGFVGGVVGGVASSDAFGELKLMGEIGNEARAKIDGREETSYTSGLARNACHFAPQSWHSWGTAHGKAETLAQRAWTETLQANQLQTQSSEIQKSHLGSTPGGQKAVAYNQKLENEHREKAAQLLNQALIENGFGDHFLQDSYAAGHLINKTQIMQWFAKWLDSKGRKRDYSTEEHWRQIQQMAYGQSGISGSDLYTAKVGETQSNDPQSVENMEGDWTERFAALGLKIPGSLQTPGTPEFRLFTWWQEMAMRGELLKTDAEELEENEAPVAGEALQAALKKLINDGVVYYNWYSTSDRAKGAERIGVGNKSLRLKQEYIPDPDKELEFLTAVRQAHQGDPAAYQKMAKAVTYDDYHNFLNHGYLQLSTNVLHDHFCQNGLDVATAQGDTPFKIYGDNAMLQNESAKGVKFSATTSRMSRDSIYELATTGTTDKSTAAIAGRFPTYARPAGSKENLSLAEWHGEGGALQKFCNDKIFDNAAAVFSKSTVAAKAKLAEQVSKDAVPEIHSGEGF